ncbi:MAG TPA: hypothetical protein VMR97_13185 [Acidimicrobiales bacterium]|nr:hypothetical protein [Acidimicrobiales bacterium]
MTAADDVASLAAAAISATAALTALAVVVILSRRVRELRETVRDLRRETVPLVRDARVMVDQAATEMLRVGDVLSSAEAVTGTVDSASRLAYRAFANPVVKLMAFSSGLGGALRRLLSPRSRRAERPTAPVSASPLRREPQSARASRSTHRRARRAGASR